MICALIFPHLIVWVSWYQNRKRTYGAQQRRDAPCRNREGESQLAQYRVSVDLKNDTFAMSTVALGAPEN
jgi:hypothetical protein